MVPMRLTSSVRRKASISNSLPGPLDHASAIHQQIKARQCSDACFNRGHIAHIQHLCGEMGCGRHAVTFCLRQPARQHLMALQGKMAGNGKPDAACAAGNKN